MAVFLDTGFLLSFKNEDDNNFSDAQTWMKRFLKNEFGIIYTSTYIFDELVTLALIRLKRSDFAINIGNYVLSSPRINLVEVTQQDFNRAWERFGKFSEERLSFTDCSILAQCERLNCNFLATFDKHFKGLIRTNIS